MNFSVDVYVLDVRLLYNGQEYQVPLFGFEFSYILFVYFLQQSVGSQQAVFNTQTLKKPDDIFPILILSPVLALKSLRRTSLLAASVALKY